MDIVRRKRIFDNHTHIGPVSGFAYYGLPQAVKPTTDYQKTEDYIKGMDKHSVEEGEVKDIVFVSARWNERVKQDIDGYTKLSILGRGAYSTIFLGRDKSQYAQLGISVGAALPILRFMKPEPETSLYVLPSRIV